MFEYVLSDVPYEWIDKSRYDDQFVFLGWHEKHRDPSRSHLLPLHLGNFRNLYQTYAKKARDLYLKMLVNHSLGKRLG